MKKTLLAIAVLGAATMTAQAANVTLYGAVDGGFDYNHTKVTTNGESTTTNSFKLADGLAGSNKVGIKGEEDLGNMKVGFKLENGFHVANGAMKTSGVLFDREARMYVKGAFGEVAAGRFGGLASAAGSYDLFFSGADAFDGGDNDVPYGFMHSTRYDNSLAYQTPEFAGLQGTLMYSFQKSGAQKDKMRDNNRYVGFGLTYNYDKLNLVGVVESQLAAKGEKNDTYKNSFTYSLGGNYDFGVAKLFAGGQFAHHSNLGDLSQGIEFKHSDGLTDEQSKNVTKLFNKSQFNGFALTLGTQIPFGADSVTIGSYFGRYKNAYDLAHSFKYDEQQHEATFLKKDVKAKDGKFTIYGIAARYEHNLSKRTSLYAGAGFGQTKFSAPDDKIKAQIAQVYAGLHHNF